jgi:hypothetical protein
MISVIFQVLREQRAALKAALRGTATDTNGVRVQPSTPQIANGPVVRLALHQS